MRWIHPATALSRFRERGSGRSGRQESIGRVRFGPGGERVLVPARVIVPMMDCLADVRVNQWIARLPEDHPLAQQHRALLGATATITWASSFNRHLAVCNDLRSDSLAVTTTYTIYFRMRW
jgi:hypothetical protein